MNEEIFAILNDADEVMESVGADPLGMKTALGKINRKDKQSKSPKANVSLNSLTATDLQNPETVKIVKMKLASLDSIDKLSTVYKKINKLLTIAGAGGTIYANRTINGMNSKESATSLGIALTLSNIALGAVNKCVKKAIDKKEYSELKKVDGLLTTSIADMKKALDKASGSEKQKLRDSINQAEQLKTYISSKQDAQFKRNI